MSLLRFRDGVAGEVASGPGCLEIEASGDAVDIQDLAREVESRVSFAFHRLEIEIFQMHPTTGDELIFVRAFARDLKFGSAKLPHQILSLLFC